MAEREIHIYKIAVAYGGDKIETGSWFEFGGGVGI